MQELAPIRNPYEGVESKVAKKLKVAEIFRQSTLNTDTVKMLIHGSHISLSAFSQETTLDPRPRTAGPYLRRGERNGPPSQPTRPVVSRPGEKDTLCGPNFVVIASLLRAHGRGIVHVSCGL